MTPKLARRQSQMPRCERSSTCEHCGQGMSCDVPSSRDIAPLHFGHRRESCRPALSSGLAARSTTAISLQAGQTPSPPQNASRPARPHPTESFPVANPQAGHVSSTSDPMTPVPYPALRQITTSCRPAKTMTAPLAQRRNRAQMEASANCTYREFHKPLSRSGQGGNWAQQNTS